jgi:HJR/Mrr/RecB family endonuclease
VLARIAFGDAAALEAEADAAAAVAAVAAVGTARDADRCADVVVERKQRARCERQLQRRCKELELPRQVARALLVSDRLRTVDSLKVNQAGSLLPAAMQTNFI